MDEKIQQKFDLAVQRIAENINYKRRTEAINIYNNKEAFRSMYEARVNNVYTHGSKDKSMRKIASYPQEIDRFFEKIYGTDYWKEKDFFKKYAREWLVIDYQKL